jgi:hypothetical protein
MGPLSAFKLKPLKNGGQGKMKSQKLQIQIETDFIVLPVLSFHSLDWAHFLRLFKLFPDLTNFLKSYSLWCIEV